MLLFLIDNKKGRSEALCLRIRENKAVFARGLYNPSQQEFIPDEPEILHSNYIRTDGEPKIELGNKIFDIFESIFKEDQITLGEFTMDQVDNNISNEYENVNNVPEEYQSPVCEDVELTEDLTIELIEKIASNIELLSDESDDDKSVLMVNESINLFKVIFPDFEISTSDINALQELRPVLHSKLKSILETSQSLLEEVENDIINCTDMELEAAYKEKALTLNNKIKNIEDLLFVMIPEPKQEDQTESDVSMGADEDIAVIKVANGFLENQQLIWIPERHGLDIVKDLYGDHDHKCINCDFEKCSHPRICDDEKGFPCLCFKQIESKGYAFLEIDHSKGHIEVRFINPKYGFTE